MLCYGAKLFVSWGLEGVSLRFEQILRGEPGQEEAAFSWGLHMYTLELPLANPNRQCFIFEAHTPIILLPPNLSFCRLSNISHYIFLYCFYQEFYFVINSNCARTPLCNVALCAVIYDGSLGITATWTRQRIWAWAWWCGRLRSPNQTSIRLLT